MALRVRVLLVDRFAAVYTPAVFVLALAVAIAGPWLFGWTALAAVYKVQPAAKKATPAIGTASSV